VYWPRDIDSAWPEKDSILPRGAGRSQGDVCLNDGGMLLDTTKLDRFIAFNRQTGKVKCEAGVTLAQLLQLTLPSGWFLPVTPGTKYVTVGGAVANDVHGKNHHRAGTFGCHVNSLGLVRSSGEELECNELNNKDMFRATIGGMGLTGVITWVEIQMKPVVSQMVDEEVIKMESLEDFWQLADESDESHEYTVAWLDCCATGKNLGKGLFMRGNHTMSEGNLSDISSWYKPKLKWPLSSSLGFLNRHSVSVFNKVFYNKTLSSKKEHRVHFNKFFYPLDGVEQWNGVYGQKGFLQYQFVVPRSAADAVLRQVLRITAQSRKASFLSTMKYFGDIKSPGMMSFPRPGLELAIDFLGTDRSTRKLLDRLDQIVMNCGGAVNPSKDARMSAVMFRQSFPSMDEFKQYKDPQISSSFWRRVSDG